MKIRLDFVTNSSSVSYIVTLHQETAEKFKKLFVDYDKESQKSRVFDLLSDNLVQHGEVLRQPMGKVYYKLFSFSKGRDMKLFEQPPQDYDFKNMPDEELLKFIYGEYFFRNRLDEIEGWGVVKLPVKVQKTPGMRPPMPTPPEVKA
ncbi:MAG TPA: hypothetical protein VLM37_07370 [Fibrobacteraceae bacterium]|nr:hypothetical protein [Fibrobacteraceae bacterium]